jgi:hypothetical protein
MNQRRDSRFHTDQPIQITVFGPPDTRIMARVKNVSGRGIGLEVENPIAVGAALKIVLDDSILLGEVIYCRNQGGTHYVGIELEQALRGLAELATALRPFSVESSRSEQLHAMKHAANQHQ